MIQRIIDRRRAYINARMLMVWRPLNEMTPKITCPADSTRASMAKLVKSTSNFKLQTTITVVWWVEWKHKFHVRTQQGRKYISWRFGGEIRKKIQRYEISYPIARLLQNLRLAPTHHPNTSTIAQLCTNCISGDMRVTNKHMDGPL